MLYFPNTGKAGKATLTVTKSVTTYFASSTEKVCADRPHPFPSLAFSFVVSTPAAATAFNLAGSRFHGGDIVAETIKTISADCAFRLMIP